MEPRPYLVTVVMSMLKFDTLASSFRGDLFLFFSSLRINPMNADIERRTVSLAMMFIALSSLGIVPIHGAFPPITEAERNLGATDKIDAPAIVLFKKAELKMQDYPREVSSYLNVNVRLKVLTEEGKAFGEVEIPHSGYYRLRDLKGRTVLPDGRTVELPKDSVFEERRSRSAKIFVTKLAFPAVEVGAILDYSYTVRWDHLFFLEPWYFHSAIPTRLSEITYIKPDNLAVQPWGVQRFVPIQSEVRNTAKGKAIRVWSEDLPGIPDEPYGYTFEALSSRYMMVPTEIIVSGQRTQLLDSWKSTCDLYADVYKAARSKDRQARKQGVTLASGHNSTIDKITAVHAFVRDEIQTLVGFGVDVSKEVKVDEVLSERRGAPVAKALVLQSMLDGLKIDNELVWVADSTSGTIDLTVANPWWFDTALVRVEIDREPIYLDAGDRRASFGHLAPYYEGTQGVLHSKKPEIIDLPEAAGEENSRRATLDLELDTEGRLAGHGSLQLNGHEAWKFLRWKDTTEATAEAWQERLANQLEGWGISDVEVEEKLSQQQVLVGWTQRQLDEAVLGDEATLEPSSFFAKTQPFTLPPDLRTTPVRMPYAKHEEITTTLSWPEGWSVDLMPDVASHSSVAGQLEVRIDQAEGGRKVTFKRAFSLAQKDFTDSAGYGAVRELYERTANSDAQDLVLVRD